MKKMFVGIAALSLMASFATPSFASSAPAPAAAAPAAAKCTRPDGAPQICSKAVKGNVPLDPNSSVWDKAAALVVPVVPQNLAAPGLAEGTIANVKVKSVHNETEIAYLLEWYDPTESDTETMMDKFSDAVALMFPVKYKTEPSFMMGDADNPVQIVYWKAAWQKDIEKGYQDVRDAYPNYNYDSYPFVDTMTDAKGNKIVVKDGEIYKPVAPEDRAINTPISKYNDLQKSYLPGLSVKNPRSKIDRTTPVEELTAIGFGTLTTQTGPAHANGKGVRSFGYWKVVLTHPLKGSYTTQDAEMEINHHHKAALAVWDGGNKNRAGRKHYSDGGWVWLFLEP